MSYFIEETEFNRMDMCSAHELLILALGFDILQVFR